MQALHLPTLDHAESEPAYSAPSNLPPVSSLIYSASDFPRPTFERYSSLYQNGEDSADPQNLYLVRVHNTCLTRDELTWNPALLPWRFTTTIAPIPGYDVVGTVEQIHSANAKPKFKQGDFVWGTLDADRGGAAADYVIIRESEAALAPRTPKDTNVGAQAEWEAMLATIPLSGLTAWQALFEHGGLDEPAADAPSAGSGRDKQDPYRILITGASGSVGVFMVQLAHLAAGHSSGSSKRPVHVTAICSSHNSDFVKSLGADVVLSYDDPRQQPWSLPTAMQSHELPPVDFVLELTGGFLEKAIVSSSACLKDDGRIISIAGPISFDGNSAVPPERQKTLRTDFFIVHPSGEQMEKLAGLVESGKVKGFVDEVFPLSRGREAMEKVQAKGAVKRGKVVLKVRS